MSVSLDDIWSQPLDNESDVQTRSHSIQDDPGLPDTSRSSLFLASSDEEHEEEDGKAPSQSKRPEIDSLFDNLDDGEQENPGALTPRAVQSSSPVRDTPDASGTTGKNNAARSRMDGKKERKSLPKLDEARLLDKHGFPALLKQAKGFKPKGKGHEASDLARLMTVYQFWAQRMYPKIQFNDTVERVEKVCRQRRMQVALSAWRDQSHGTINGISLDRDMDVDMAVDVTTDSPSLRDQTEITSAPSPPPIIRPPISPPQPFDEHDDYDIDALLAEEDEISQHPSSRSTTGLARTSEGLEYAKDLATPANSRVDAPAEIDENEQFWEELDELQAIAEGR